MCQEQETYATDSNLSALGSDITPASAIPFPTNVQVGSRAEITDTRKIYYRDDLDFKELGTLPVNYRSESWYEQLSQERLHNGLQTAFHRLV